MKQIEAGDYVGRISYNMDIVFVVDRIISVRGAVDNNKRLAILKGVDIRIEADSYLDDLEIIDKKIVKENDQFFKAIA